MSDYILVTGELKHHGVKGMKWGVRKKRYDKAAKMFPREAERVRQYEKKASKYHAKADGTGNILDGTYKPPKNTSDASWTKNKTKAHAYERKANLLEARMKNSTKIRVGNVEREAKKLANLTAKEYSTSSNRGEKYMSKMREKYKYTLYSDIKVNKHTVEDGRTYCHVLIGRVDDSPYDGSPRYRVEAGTWTKN